MQTLELDWSDFKTNIIAKGFSFREIDVNNTYYLYTQDGPYAISCSIYKDSGAAQTEYEASYRSKKVDRLVYMEKDGRQLMAGNRVPPGYSLYITGEADNIAAGTYGGGTALKFDGSNQTKYFQLLNHYYAIGARAGWESCDMDSYFNATLIAPATTGLTNTTGDYNKTAVGGGINMIVPVTAGTGSWSLSLTATLTNTQILKCTPVPVVGNTGWFDYDPDTNTLTRNMTQTGGYNLFDADINLHSFGRKIWGSKQDGWQSALDVAGLVGKLLFNSWKLKLDFALDSGLFSSQKAAIHFIVAAKRNI